MHGSVQNLRVAIVTVMAALAAAAPAQTAIRGTSDEPAVFRPLVRHVYLVAPHIVALTVDARHVTHGTIRPWVKPQGYPAVTLDSVSMDAGAGNLVANGTFEGGTTHWELVNSGGAQSQVALDTDAPLHGAGSGRVNISAGTSSEESVALGTPAAVEQGGCYSIRFMARADANRPIVVAVCDNDSPQTEYFRRSVQLSPRAESYVLPFESTNADASARLVFYLGGEHQVATTLRCGYRALSSSVFPEEIVDFPVAEMGAEETRLWRMLTHNGTVYGFLAGRLSDHYLPFDRIHGHGLDVSWAGSAGSYLLHSTDDAAYVEGSRPVSVYRKSKPHMRASWFNDTYARKFGHGERHEIYLTFPSPLVEGATYSLDFANNASLATVGPGVSFTFTYRTLRTEALHVNQNGYHPDQWLKRAFLSTWMGDGGGVDYAGIAARGFELIDTGSGDVVYSGSCELTLGADETESHQSDDPNYIHADFYCLDFSDFTTPGTYRVAVPGLGCSFPFDIHEHVWERAFRIQMKGVLVQRSGIALGPPHLSFERPVNFHPEHGVPVHRCDPAAFALAYTGASNPFDAIQASILGPDDGPGWDHHGAWGGYADAADFDRQARHCGVAMMCVLLYDCAPEYFHDFSLGIPESDNAIPDILDEARWGLDVWKRVQQDDGAIPDRIESIEHPSPTVSWLDELPVALTPPTTVASYTYAGAAALLADVLGEYDAAAADSFRQSALAAAEWAEAHYGGDLVIHDREDENRARNYAAACLLRLTRDERWETAFRQTETFSSKRVHYEDLGPVVYALLDGGGIDESLHQSCRVKLLESLDGILDYCNNYAYDGISPVGWYSPQTHFFAVHFVAAWRITGDRKYAEKLLRHRAFAMGANPMNLCLFTGMGSRYLYPYHKDMPRTGNSDAPGISCYVATSTHFDINKLLNSDATVYPEGEWPQYEGFADGGFHAPVHEFVIDGTLMQQALVSGFLAHILPDTEPSLSVRRPVVRVDGAAHDPLVAPSSPLLGRPPPVPKVESQSDAVDGEEAKNDQGATELPSSAHAHGPVASLQTRTVSTGALTGGTAPQTVWVRAGPDLETAGVAEPAARRVAAGTGMHVSRNPGPARSSGPRDEEADHRVSSMLWRPDGEHLGVRAVSASSWKGPNRTSRACDGDVRTWWMPAKGDQGSLVLDLDGAHLIDAVSLLGYVRFGTRCTYTLDVSLSGSRWRHVHTEELEGKGTSELRLRFGPAAARLIRITVIAHAGSAAAVHEVAVHPVTRKTLPDRNR